MPVRKTLDAEYIRMLPDYETPSVIEAVILPKWLLFWIVSEGFRVQGYASHYVDGRLVQSGDESVFNERDFRRALHIWKEQIGVDHVTTGVVANTDHPWRWVMPEFLAQHADHDETLAHFMRCCWAWAAAREAREPVLGVDRFAEQHVCPKCQKLVEIEYEAGSWIPADKLDDLCFPDCALIASTTGQKPLRVALWPD